MADKKKEVKTADRKKNPKKKKKLTPFLKLICYIIIGASAFLFYEVFSEIYTTFQLKKQLAEVEEKYQQVLDENAYLTSEKEKLEDPDYVASYARGTYLLSKDDEQIFYLPENNDR